MTRPIDPTRTDIIPLPTTTPTPTPTPAPSTGTATPGVSIFDNAFSPLGTFEGGEEAAIQAIIGKVINGLLGVSGIIALLMFVYGGVSRMLAQGNSTKIEESTKTLVWSVLGLFIIFCSYAVVNFVLAALGQG